MPVYECPTESARRTPGRYLKLEQLTSKTCAPVTHPFMFHYPSFGAYDRSVKSSN